MRLVGAFAPRSGRARPGRRRCFARTPWWSARGRCRRCAAAPAPPCADREQPVHQRRADVADMDASRGGRRETEANGHYGKTRCGKRRVMRRAALTCPAGGCSLRKRGRGSRVRQSCIGGAPWRRTSREIRLKSRPVGMPEASNFEVATVEIARSRRRRSFGAQCVDVGRSLHARAHVRPAELCAAVSDRPGAARRRRRHGGEVERSEVRSRAIWSRASMAGAKRTSRLARAEQAAGRACRRKRISACSACRA